MAQLNVSISPAKLQGVVLQLGSIALCLAFWQVASTQRLDFGLVTFSNVPTPAAVLAAVWQLIHSDALWPHLTSSLGRVFTGYTTAAFFGISIGLIVGRSKRAEKLLIVKPKVPIIIPAPQPPESSIWSLALSSTLYSISTVPVVGFGTGFTPKASGLK